MSDNAITDAELAAWTKTASDDGYWTFDQYHQSRSAMPRLLAEVTRLRALLERAGDYLGDYGMHEIKCPAVQVAMATCTCQFMPLLNEIDAALAAAVPPAEQEPGT